MQNDTHTRLSDAALPVAAKDLETNQVSIHKAKSMTTSRQNAIQLQEKGGETVYGPRRREGKSFC